MTGMFDKAAQQFLDDDGNPANAAKVYYYEPDGAFSTEKTVYKNKALTTAWTQPIVLGADGRPVGAGIFLDGDYDRRLNASDDSNIRDDRNIGDQRSAVLTDLSENLVSNGSFETDTDSDGEPDNWTETDSGSGTMGRITSDNYRGTACYEFQSPEAADKITSDYIEVSPGRKLELSFAVKASNAAANATIWINYYDDDQVYISTNNFYSSGNGLTPTDWTYVEGISHTIGNSTTRYIRLLVFGDRDAGGYTTKYDDIRLTQPENLPEAQVKPTGLIISRDSGDTEHDITVTAGSVLSSDETTSITLQSDITKKLDTTFAVGDGNGGAGPGFSLPATGIFPVYLIASVASGAVDVMASLSWTSPTLPTGFSKYRRIGALRTDASNNLDYVEHRGIDFFFGAHILDVNDSSMTENTYETGTLSVPPNSMAFGHAKTNVTSGTDADAGWFIRHPDMTGDMWRNGVGMTSATVDEPYGGFMCFVDENRQLEYTTQSSATATFTLHTSGFRDYGRDDPNL